MGHSAQLLLPSFYKSVLYSLVQISKNTIWGSVPSLSKRDPCLSIPLGSHLTLNDLQTTFLKFLKYCIGFDSIVLLQNRF